MAERDNRKRSAATTGPNLQVSIFWRSAWSDRSNWCTFNRESRRRTPTIEAGLQEATLNSSAGKTGVHFQSQALACVRIHYAPHNRSYPGVSERRLGGTSEKGCCPECGASFKRILKPTEEYAKQLGKSVHDHQNDLGRGMRVDTKVYEKALRHD